ncbi:MAG: WbuC family cupin fold metalloprotein [Planctomycetia bacterium]
MLTLAMKSTECYETEDKIPRVGAEELAFLGSAIDKSPRRRSRICTHRSVQERLHEMFVIYSDRTFVRPNKHIGKDESVFVIRGRADFLFFDEAGNVTQVVEMGDAASGKAYYCRVPEGVFHTIIMRSPEVVLFEGTPGPFNPAETVYADWGPQEEDVDGVAHYREWMDAEVARHRQSGPRRLIGLDAIGPLVLVATDRVVPLSATENSCLVERRRREQLDRLRICVHKTGEDRLHEMLMTFAGSSYIRPSMHVDKEESLYFLEGLATYVFFDDAGEITATVKLGPEGSGRDFYCRIPANTWHALVVESPDVLVKETTSGPFRRSDTIFPAWAPDGTDRTAVDRYLADLRSRI